MKAPKRQKKSDRLLWGHTSAVEVKNDMTLALLTWATEQTNMTWGSTGYRRSSARRSQASGARAAGRHQGQRSKSSRAVGWRVIARAEGNGR